MDKLQIFRRGECGEGDGGGELLCQFANAIISVPLLAGVDLNTVPNMRDHLPQKVDLSGVCEHVFKQNEVRQTRRGDEIVTVILKCQNCGMIVNGG